MPLLTGTLTLDEMADESDAQTAAVRLAQMGEERVEQAIQDELDAWNAGLAEQLGEFVEITTDNQRPDAAHGDDGEMVPLTETGRAPTQVVTRAPVTLGIPLVGWQYAIGWTQRALDRASARKLGRQIRSAERAHVRKVTASLQAAMYVPTNYTIRDYLVENKIDLAVKRFYNADGWPIPNDQYGAAFDGDVHTHYLAGALSPALAMALIDTVREHRPGADVRVAINQADEADWAALAGFKPYLEQGVVRGAGDLEGRDIDMADQSNRAIGRFHGAEVWVKPWAYADYPIAYAMSGPRPLALRVPEGTGGAPALRVRALNRAYPLIAEFMESEFGFGTVNRAGAAVLYTGGGTDYVVPTIAGVSFTP